MSDHATQPASAWKKEQVVRITASSGANLHEEQSLESAVIRHYAEGHTLPVNSFEVLRKNGCSWYRVEAWNGHGIGYVSASLTEPEYVSRTDYHTGWDVQ